MREAARSNGAQASSTSVRWGISAHRTILMNGIKESFWKQFCKEFAID
jgi:hypothetical protein